MFRGPRSQPGGRRHADAADCATVHGVDSELDRAISVVEPHPGVQLLGYLTRAVTVLEASTRPVLKEASGLEGPEFDMLLRLWQLPGHKGQATAVGTAMGLTSSGITRLVARALDKELVTRRPDPHDGRGFVLFHTDKGKKALFAALQAHAAQLDDELIALLTPGELNRLMTLMVNLDARL